MRCTLKRLFIKLGFKAPGYLTGDLVGQNGWTAGVSASGNAAQIIAASGGQELEISGPLVALNNSSFNKSLTNYNPVASGTPIVDVSADIWQNQGPTTSQSSWQFAFLILNDQNGNAYGTIAIDKNGVVFGQNWGSPNQVIGDGSTATNGFHNLKMELNFTNRAMILFKDGFSIGSMTFNPTSSNKLGSVSLILQGGSSIDSTLFVDNLNIYGWFGDFNQFLRSSDYECRAMFGQRHIWHAPGRQYLRPQRHFQRQRTTQAAFPYKMDDCQCHILLQQHQRWARQWLLVVFHLVA